MRLSLPNGRIQLIAPPPAEDDSATQALFTHPIVIKFLPFWSPNATVEDIRIRRETRERQPETYLDMAIHHLPPHSLESTGLPKLLGTTGFLNMQSDNCATEAGIIIAPEAHRSGYASEALFVLFDYGFKAVEEGGLGMNRITMTTAAMNDAMCGWLENVLEAKRESTLREAWKSGDGFIDAAGYGILRREWLEGGARSRLLARVEKAIAKETGQQKAGVL